MIASISYWNTLIQSKTPLPVSTIVLPDPNVVPDSVQDPRFLVLFCSFVLLSLLLDSITPDHSDLACISLYILFLCHVTSVICCSVHIMYNTSTECNLSQKYNLGCITFDTIQYFSGLVVVILLTLRIPPRPAQFSSSWQLMCQNSFSMYICYRSYGNCLGCAWISNSELKVHQ